MVEKPPGLTGYQHAIEGAAYYLHDNGGLLQVAGPDQASFIQRQTTNDIHLLNQDNGLLTVLTSPTARILDVIYLFLDRQTQSSQAGSSPAIGLITLPGQGSQTYVFLKSRIFFMDKVTINDRSSEHIQIDLLGPDAHSLLVRMGLGDSQTPDRLKYLPMSTGEVLVLPLERPIGLGFRILAPQTSLKEVERSLANNGAVELNTIAYETLMVEAGLPRSAHELTEEYTPLEVGLGSAVSSTKGCYTGQEIIARQITYDKVTQHLCGLRLTAPVDPGSPIDSDGRRVGTVTSVVRSPRFGEIALAVVKRPYNATEMILSLAGGAAEVVDLPFAYPGAD